MEEKNVPKVDLILALSESLDLISPAIVGHHIRVAFLSLNIALMLNMQKDDVKSLIYSALLHDVGALSLKDRLDGLEFDLKDPHLHSLVGHSLLKMHKPFERVSNIVRCHHVSWNNINKFNEKNIDVPLSSQVIHLADRVDVLMDWRRDLPNQMDCIMEQITKEKGKKFNPDIVEAFAETSRSKLIWQNLSSNNTLTLFNAILGDDLLDMDEMLNISKIFEKIIDFRSRFTATHSSGVAHVACNLAEISGMTKREIKMMRIAGNLHDLGKLAVPKKLLEKPASLSHDEFDIVKKHVYYTYSILKKIRGIGEIYEWAGLHHERLNGKGYPFNKTDAELSLGSRIMAVADIFTAITEDRPYREGMKKERALFVLEDMARRNEIDKDIVSMLKTNYNVINEGRICIQKEIVNEFKGFWDEVNLNHQAV
ncbi:HD domain-containing protein [Wukongibacter baidiensis]|uniref:HD-GYP domain-containing protein n=1 Tax=Wukongibacter baidiensis TaxID=1723361 RepID=UPI003D7FEB6B